MKYLNIIRDFLAMAMILLIIVGIMEYFSGSKSDKERHIICLELGVDKAKCKEIFNN